MCLLGCDIGSSSIKVSIVDEETGLTIGADFYPKEEAPIKALRPGWAEQNPEDWWSYVKIAMKGAMSKAKVKGEDIKAIGISYQMHGLVVVDKKMEVLRPSIIWCDSRAVPYGERAFKNIGEKRCLSHLLNSPGNFTASKLAWIKEYEPDIYDRIHKIMLPGDFIAMRLTGDIVTTVSGLSEGIFWDFKNNALSEDLMNYYGFIESGRDSGYRWDFWSGVWRERQGELRYAFPCEYVRPRESYDGADPLGCLVVHQRGRYP